jgi:hypothetical protein
MKILVQVIMWLKRKADYPILRGADYSDHGGPRREASDRRRSCGGSCPEHHPAKAGRSPPPVLSRPPHQEKYCSKSFLSRSNQRTLDRIRSSDLFTARLIPGDRFARRNFSASCISVLVAKPLLILMSRVSKFNPPP